jgi:hypothetical protein
MKKLLFLFSFLLFSVVLLAQKKSLPACGSVATEIAKINATFDNLVLNATRDAVYPPTTICAVRGVFETVEGMANFTFKFTDDDYTGKKAAFDVVFENIYQALKVNFGSSHDITSDSSLERRSWHFNEKGKTWQEARLNANLYITYVNSLSELPKFAIELEFSSKMK